MTSLRSMFTARGAPRVETASLAGAFAGARRFTASGAASSIGASLMAALAAQSAKPSLPIVQALVVQECCFGCARLMDSSLVFKINHCLLTESLHSRRRLWLGLLVGLQPLAASAPQWSSKSWHE